MKFFDNIFSKMKNKNLKLERNGSKRARTILKDDDRRFFLSCLTKEAHDELIAMENELKEENNEFFSNYDTLLKNKWHLTNDCTMMYKENSEAYLVISENGFVIDQENKQSPDAIEEEELLLRFCHDIVSYLFEYSCKYLDIHTKRWETLPYVDQKVFERVAKSLGYYKEIDSLAFNEKPKTK